MIPISYLIDPRNTAALREAMRARGAEETFEKFLKHYFRNQEILPSESVLEDMARQMTLEQLNNPKDELSNMLCAYLDLPNISHSMVPFGSSARDNVVISSSKQKEFNSTKNYQEIGLEFGIFSREMNEMIAESGFPLLFGVGPKLERALIELMLEHHVRYGYEEISVPTVIHERTLFLAGSFPKHQDNVYKLESSNLYLNPTIEMQQTSLIFQRCFRFNELPLKVVGFARSFRIERGRRMDFYTNLHEFGKVESFTACTEDQHEQVLKDLSGMLEALLDKLGFVWRKLLLCTGDMGQAGSFTCDYEIYAPGSDKWLEISSLSYRDTFQAMRLDATYVDADGSRHYLHTYNTPGFAIPRVLSALLEYMYREDGRLVVPDCLIGRANLPAVISVNDYPSKSLTAGL